MKRNESFRAEMLELGISERIADIYSYIYADSNTDNCFEVLTAKQLREISKNPMFSDEWADAALATFERHKTMTPEQKRDERIKNTVAEKYKVPIVSPQNAQSADEIGSKGEYHALWNPHTKTISRITIKDFGVLGKTDRFALAEYQRSNEFGLRIAIPIDGLQQSPLSEEDEVRLAFKQFAIDCNSFGYRAAGYWE